MKTPITSIAYQMHLYGKEFIDSSTRQQKMKHLKAEIARYKTIGIEVIVPEMDISMHEVGESISPKLQAQIEHDSVLTLLESGVTDINHFGITDKLNWRQQEANGGGLDALATNFDFEGKPKINYYSDMQAIAEFLSQKVS